MKHLFYSALNSFDYEIHYRISSYLEASVAALVKDNDRGPNVGGPKDISLLLGLRLEVAKIGHFIFIITKEH